MSGMFGASQFFFGDTGFYPYEINSSLRLSRDSSEFLSRTMTSTGDRKQYTFSCWIKRNQLQSASLLSVGSTADDRTEIGINGDQLFFKNEEGGDEREQKTTMVLRDVSSWYHICVAINLGSGGNSQSKVKLFINGTQQTDLSTNNTMVDTHSLISTQNPHTIGKSSYANQDYADIYLAEVHFVGGSQLDPTSFTETKNGVLIPKEYTGSHGTNGFYLKFNQTGTGTASASTIGADSSGNSNHFTSSALASIDANRTDAPTNNFATFNTQWGGAGTYGTHGTIVNGGLELSSVGSATNAFCTQTLPSSGKYYVEMRVSSLNSFSGGVMQTAPSIHRSVLFQTDGTIDQDNSQVQSGLGSFSAGDTIGMLADMDAGTIQFKVENSNYGSAVTLTSLDSQGQYAFMCRANAYVEFRTDTKDMEFSIPDGYTTLSTANYPEPSISPLNGEKPTDYFDTIVFAGNGSSQNVSGLSFQPDWLWFKSRSSANKHKLYDAVRGVEKTISSSGTSAESTESTTLTEFRSDGFAVGSNDAVNKNSDSIVAWSWLAGGAPSADNSAGVGATPTANSVKIDGSNLGSALAGTIAATRLTANTEAGFSIVSYTGSGSNATVAHGLGVAPKWVIVKKRNGTGDWVVWHQGLGDGTKYIILDTNQAVLTASNIWNSTIPTSSVFSVGTHTTTNNSSDTYIAYCFAEFEGYSKFGAYTGNGSTDGTFVYTGFRPAWVIFKRSDSTASWFIADIKRDVINPLGKYLFADLNDDENTASDRADFYSNGFKAIVSNTNQNADSGTYIYMAFAEQPFKYANAR